MSKTLIGIILIFYIGSSFGQNVNYNDSMMFYYNQNKFEKAIYFGKMNLDKVKQKWGNKDSLYGKALDQLGDFYEAARELVSAKQLYEEALEIYRNVFGERNTNYLTLLRKTGVLLSTMTDYPEAQRRLLLCLNIQKEMHGEKEQVYAKTLNDLAVIYRNTGKYTEAERLCIEGINILKVIGNTEEPDYLNALNNLGTIYYYTGRYAQTERIFLDIAEIKKKSLGTEHLEYADALNQVGAVYFILGNYKDAADLFSKALLIYEKKLGKGNPRNVGALGNLGNCYIKLGETKKAETCLKEQITLYEKSTGKNYIEYPRALNSLAVNYFNTDKDTLCEKLIREALEIRRATLGEDHFETIQSLNNLAVYFTLKRKFSIADSIYSIINIVQKTKFGVDHPDYLLFASNQCEVYQHLHKYELASKLSLQLLPKENELLLNRLNFMTEKELLPYLKIKEPVFSIPYSSLMYYQLPDLIKSVYNSILLTKGAAAQNTSLLASKISQSNDSLVAKNWEAYKRNRLLLSKTLALPILQRKINTDSLANLINRQEKDLLKISVDFKELKQRNNISWGDVKKNLTTDAVALEFIRFSYVDSLIKTRYYYAALILTNNDSVPVYVPLFDESELSDVMKKFSYKALTTYGKKQTQEVSRKQHYLKKTIYDLLWQPLEKYFKNKSTIYFSPDGLLHQISFSTIPINDSKLLMDKYRLVQLTSTREIALKDSVQPLPSSAILLGGINYAAQNIDTLTKPNLDAYNFVYQQNHRGIADSFRYLPNTLTEVESIALQFKSKGCNTYFFSGQNASESNFRSICEKIKPTVIHFATHGFTLPDTTALNGINNTYTSSKNPLLRTGLVMAGGNNGWKARNKDDEDDGILTGMEIAAMQLPNTQLAVLSACETANGEIKGSEGVFGLQRAFKLAGVKYVMASLWQVPDLQTKEFMDIFYSNWMQKLTIQEAFNRTQQKMHKKYPPYYWAGFTLIH